MSVTENRSGSTSSRSQTSPQRWLRGLGLAALLSAAAWGCASVKAYRPPSPEAEMGELRGALAGVLAEQLRVQGVPGIQLSVRVGARELDLCAGSMDHRRRVPLRPDHVLRAGSVTKIFTAAVVLALSETGMLSLDDTIEGWFPLLPHASRITVRSLLNHTSGVYDYTRDRSFQGTTFLFSGKRWEPEELYRFVLSGPPDFLPGTRHLYSNSNYLLLGILAEGLSGAAYAELVREQVLEPAGMHRTYVLPVEPTPAALVVGYDRDVLPGGLRRIRPGNRAWPSGAFSAGAVATTSSDLLALIDTLFYGQILSAESLEAMNAFVPAADEDMPYQTGYGLGLRRLEVQGDVLLGHTGTIPGFGAVVVHCPDRDYSIAALANLSMFDPLSLLDALIRVLHDLPGP